MEAKDFELPLEGSLSKLALLHTQQEEQPKSISHLQKPKNNPEKSLQKKRKSSSKKKK